ncbi:hypothetical protein D3C72_2371100 [compost metagenome]
MEGAARLELGMFGQDIGALRFYAEQDKPYVRMTFKRPCGARDDDFRTIVAAHHVKRNSDHACLILFSCHTTRAAVRTHSNATTLHIASDA